MSPPARDQPRLDRPLTKVSASHLERLAAVYIRQSTQHQVLHHQESTRLQYDLAKHAHALGWPPERVLVIDDDLGCSGASAEGRVGFQRLVAEVGMGHVGIILGVETSRLARSCRDWHHLLEICALFQTLISDLDGIYDPANYNDRLLLGLKGTMSEAELHIIKQRMIEGKRAKARRGELGMLLPIGYIRRSSVEIIKDPDEQAQTVVQTIFEQFEARGTVTGVLAYLVEKAVRVPVRARSGLSKGELTWSRPNRPTLQNLLKHPTYAGAYVYGRRPTDPRCKKPGRPATGRKVAAMAAWEVFLPGRLPAYITWEQYEANQKRLEANRMKHRGVVRRGSALLVGLLRCGRCGRRMVMQDSDGYPRYTCNQEMSSYAGDLCQSLAARVLDRAVEAQVLRALEPSALEVSLDVAASLEGERARAAQLWEQQLERACYEVERAVRQYNAVEPENRLVARTLERQLEERLAEQKKLQEEHRRYEREQPTRLTAAERDGIRRLAIDLPELWNAETTTLAQKQTIVRHLVDRIDVTVKGDTERVAVVVEWAGGHSTALDVVRPVARSQQLSYYDDLIRRIRALRKDGLMHKAIASQLNEEGWRPPKRRETFTGAMIRALVAPHESPPRTARESRWPRPKLKPAEWLLSDLAAKRSMPPITLYSWVVRGWVTARKTAEPHSVWVIRANAAEIERLRDLRTTRRGRWVGDRSSGA
jgi:DNA invertase Pin-like site-specific DNA recombinase